MCIVRWWQATDASVEIVKLLFLLQETRQANSMLKNLGTLFAVTIISLCGAANAEQADDPHAVFEAALNAQEDGYYKPVMDVILNENVYQILPTSSTMEFRVDSPIGDIWASFEDFEGHFLMLKRDSHNALATIDINASSLDADGGFIGMMLKGENFFDVENFPSMRFVGSSFEWLQDRRGVLKGYMTIKNVTRQVAFYVELVGSDENDRFSDRLTVTASTTIKRSEFGIRTLLPVVSDNVNLFMSIDAIRKNASVSMN